MSGTIVHIAGSPSPSSRSSYVADVVAAHARREGFATRSFALRDFDPADVLFARVNAPELEDFLAAVRDAAAIVLSSPVYKASYAGGLKAIVDLIPPDAIADRPALGIATTRLPAHAREVERAYHALFAFFRARALAPLVVLDEELRLDDGAGTFAPVARERVEESGRVLVGAARARSA